MNLSIGHDEKKHAMKRLHPRATWFFFIKFFFKPGIFLAVFLFLFFLFGSGFVLNKFYTAPTPQHEEAIIPYWILASLVLALITLVIIFYVWARLTYHFYRYELKNNEFRKELGVIRKRYVSIPYDRVQNVNISRTLLARLLGISAIQIETAGKSGSTGAEGNLPGLSIEDAEKLRSEIIRRVNQSTDQGL